MLNESRILVFTDFKPASDLVLRAAENIRKKTGGQIHVLHVSDIPVRWDWVAEGVSALLMNNKVINELSDSLHKMMANQIRRCEIHCTSKVSIGPVFEGLSDAIAKHKPDILMMGHDQHAPNLINLGSIVAKIVSSSTVPVLVIKKNLSFIPAIKVAALVDTESGMNSILEVTEELAMKLSAGMEVISLWKQSNSRFFEMAPAEKIAPDSKLSSESREILLGKIREDIHQKLIQHKHSKIRIEVSDERQVAYHLAKIMEEDNVDLAVMRRHQRGMLEKMFIGSETRRMLEIFDGNILVLPP
jgi:nucleotide-binding universal stress UspA family protein